MPVPAAVAAGASSMVTAAAVAQVSASSRESSGVIGSPRAGGCSAGSTTSGPAPLWRLRWGGGRTDGVAGRAGGSSGSGARLRFPVVRTAGPAPLPTGTDVDYQLGGATEPAAERRHRGPRPHRAAGGRSLQRLLRQRVPDPAEREGVLAQAPRRWCSATPTGARWSTRPGASSCSTSAPAAKRQALAAIVDRWVRGCARTRVRRRRVRQPRLLHPQRRAADPAAGDPVRRPAGAVRARRTACAAGQKNLAGFDGTTIGYDFAVAEECGRYDECQRYVDDFGDQVLMIEYRSADFYETCTAFGSTPCGGAARPRPVARGRARVVLTSLHTTSLGDSGSRVVFCHGLFGQGKNWSAIGKALAEDHRVLLVDMPDHGQSPWSDRFDYLAAAEQVADCSLLSEDEDPSRWSVTRWAARSPCWWRCATPTSSSGSSSSTSHRSLRPRRRVRPVHRGDARPRPRPASSGAARRTPRCRRRCRTRWCAASCSRACAATATGGGGC